MESTLEQSTWRQNLQAELDQLRAKIPADVSDDVSVEELIRQLEDTSRQLEAAVNRMKQSAQLRALENLVEQIQARAPSDLTDEEIDREVKESITEARTKRPSDLAGPDEASTLKSKLGASEERGKRRARRP